MKIQYVNPAGNITAIIEGYVPMAERISLSRKILDKKCAEQVGFETSPALGGSYRLEMMGGEFCGNAARSFGYLKALEQFQTGTHTIKIEVSGADTPIDVTVNLETSTSFAQMPIPLRLEELKILEETYPVVICHGIIHLIALDITPSEEFVTTALEAMKCRKQDAYGIMFLDSAHKNMVPAVYVPSTDSLVWESSCGSGSVACAWYLATTHPAKGNDSERFLFTQPGGSIQVDITTVDGTVSSCIMGGEISIMNP